MNKIIQYIKDVRTEVAKVNWPTREEVKGATILVICLSIVSALFVFACDTALSSVMNMFLNAR